MKKIIVISDIHSNHIALRSALDFVDEIKPDGIAFLGDYVTDCPYPQKTMKLLYEYKEKYPCWFVRGNREDYILNHHRNPNDGWCYSSSTGALLYTYENLTEKDLDFFASMPPSCEIDIEGCPIITACHASPADTHEWIKGKNALLDKYTSKLKGDILLCGHTHKAEVCSCNNKTVIFCPSVGQPQDGAESTRITVLCCEDGHHWQYELLQLPFSPELLISEFAESGLIEKSRFFSLGLFKAFYEKTDFALQFVRLAFEKARADGNEVANTLPEKYWRDAALECGLINFANTELEDMFGKNILEEWKL